MRVVATETFKVYRNMVCIDVAEGEVHDGEFAQFLVDHGTPVRPADNGDVAPEPGAGDGNPPEPGDPSAVGQTDPDDPDGEDPGGPGEPDGLDITGTAAAVLEWVDGDPERAAAAHAAEAGRDKPRSTLLKKLADIAGS